jgi:hypothetical protein
MSNREAAVILWILAATLAIAVVAFVSMLSF